MMIQIDGGGLINMTSVLNVDYVFDVSSVLVKRGQAMVLKVVGNMSNHAPGTQDLYTIAFSFNYTNTLTRQHGFQPTVEAVMPDGVVVESMRTDAPSSGIGGSGVEYCSGVQVVGDTTVLPGRNTELTGGASLRIYQEIKHDGLAECIFVIQPENPNEFLLKLSFDEYDLNEETERVEIFNGDSPSAPRMGILYKKTYTFGSDPKYFYAGEEMFVEECAVTFRLQARRNVPAGQKELLGYVKGRMGFALTYDLVDPSKMNHFKAQLGFGGMVDSVTDKAIQLKLRKVFGAAMGIMYPSVVFDSASDGRRYMLLDVHVDRRSGTGAASVRVLCTSPDSTLQKADKFASDLNAGLVTSSMNDAGIPGGVVLTAPIQVFRCGIELECVPTEPVVVPPPPTTPIPLEQTPLPFPLEAVVRLSLALILGPLSVAFCICVLYLVLKRQEAAKIAAKKQQGIDAYDVWIEEKSATLKAMSGRDLGVMAEKYELVEENKWDPAEMYEMIPEMAKFFFRTERGCGFMPEGVFKYVPESMYAEGKPVALMKAKPSAAEQKEKDVVEVETAQVSADLHFQEGSEAKNDAKKRVKKKPVPQHTVKWVKRAVKEETQEEVAV